MMDSLLLQVLALFAFMLAANYFVIQRKSEARLQVSLIMSGAAALAYGFVVWLLQG